MAIGGWSGWPYAVGSSMLLKNSGGETIRVYCILDRDYHFPAEVDKRLHEATERGVQLHVWSRKEIENYLLVPSLIARVVTELKTQKGPDPSEDEVTDSLSRLADGLRDETLDALATELHTADRSGGVGRANRLARERVEAAWQTIDGKLGIVSGKQLISNLSSWSQATYGVALSVARLSATMSAAEIPSAQRMGLERYCKVTDP
jgi:hypothetical protein